MNKHHMHRHEENIEEKDPVCKMKISPKTATDEIDFSGQRFYFCSPNCRLKFESDPEKYLPSTKKFRS